MKLDKNSDIKEVNKFIKEEIHKLVEGHRFEHDVFYQALEEVVLSVAPLYLSDENMQNITLSEDWQLQTELLSLRLNGRMTTTKFG